MVAPAIPIVVSFIARSGVAAAIKKFGKRIVDSAIEAGKKSTTTSNKSGKAISEFTKKGTGSQTVTRNVAQESIKRGAAAGVVGGAGAGVGGYAALNSNSGSDNKKSRASVSSKPNVSEFPRQPFNSRGVRYNKVTDADVARVRAKTAEAKAKQTPASVTIKAGDTLSEIAKANDMSVAQIKAINDIKNVNEIKPGQRIKLRTNDPYENKMSKGGKATKKKK